MNLPLVLWSQEVQVASYQDSKAGRGQHSLCKGSTNKYFRVCGQESTSGSLRYPSREKTHFYEDLFDQIPNIVIIIEYPLWSTGLLMKRMDAFGES